MFLLCRCHYECGLPYDTLKFNEIGSENYSQMLKCSPIQYVKNVNVPVLIELGDSDLRVPGNQGKQFYFALQTAGKETKYVHMWVLYFRYNYTVNILYVCTCN